MKYSYRIEKLIDSNIKVGDKVRIIAELTGHTYKSGQITTIVELTREEVDGDHEYELPNGYLCRHCELIPFDFIHYYEQISAECSSCQTD